ncbi:amidohydrolase family protein [Curvibacter sp. APW13]|uniref:amidohydrolase family protein n=1 Tax=Curvibacter sp. APW13 TaxID=3077236 RepID=UPI0028DF46E6|nr:amidohydrolase family protein [Curvibacter sp. APW13]MDT8989731.1 amidohydrolase family protein [Curvibacter sp. APW13]
MRGKAWTGVLGGLMLLVGAANAQEWVDVHFHWTMDDAGSTQELVEKSLAIMQSENIRTLVVSSQPRPGQAGADFLEVQKQLAQHGKRFAVLAGGNSLNPLMHQIHEGKAPAEAVEKFRALAQRSAASGVKGFGEIALHHLSLNDQHAYEAIPADDALVRVLVDVVAEQDLVLDVHFDPVLAKMARPASLTSPNNPAEFEPNFEAFERMLAHNRKARIVWAHAGGVDMLGNYTPQLVQSLLERHPNLFFSLRPMGREPGVMLQAGGGPMKRRLNPEWVNVVEKYPDRFVLGSDSFLVADAAQRVGAARIFSANSHRQRQAIREVLSALRSDVARKVGYENAERLYKLN